MRPGALVHERARFAIRELSGRRVLGHYRPRGCDLRVYVRHNFPGRGEGSFDHFPLEEVFGDRCYEPPEHVDRAVRDRGAGARIVDLGGHLGYFGAFALSRYPEARLVSFEPEPTHAALLRECISLNGLEDRWELVEAGAHVRDETLRLAGNLSIGSHLASLSGDDEGAVEVAARDVLPYLSDADLVKIDIEGAEWALLADDRLAEAPPRAVVLEYHSTGAPEDNPKRAVRRRLTELGYTTESEDSNPEDEPFWGRGLMWGWLGPRGERP